MSAIEMPKITVYRKWTEWETDGDGNTVGDEPETIRESEETFECYPDAIDQSEGVTTVDMAVAVLEGKLYVTETSSVPWTPGSWYSACLGSDWTYGMDGADEDLTAHLSGFSEEEERKIFETVSKRVPNMR